jgi:hypothetical protein
MPGMRLAIDGMGLITVPKTNVAIDNEDPLRKDLLFRFIIVADLLSEFPQAFTQLLDYTRKLAGAEHDHDDHTNYYQFHRSKSKHIVSPLFVKIPREGAYEPATIPGRIIHC